MREAILRVDRRGRLWTISRMFSRVLISGTTSLSDCTATLGRQQVSRIVWWIRENTPLDGILRSGKRLWCSSTAACAFPSQNACHNIPRGKTQKAFYNSTQLTGTVTTFDTKSQCACAWSGCRLKDGQAQCTGNITRHRYSTWNRKKTTLFYRHYIHNRSTSDIGVWVISVYFNLRNILPKSDTFPPGQPVYFKLFFSQIVCQYHHYFTTISQFQKF